MTADKQLARDVERVRHAIKPGPLGWQSESIFRLLFGTYADARELTFDETCAAFDWIDRIQAELRGQQ